MVSSTTFGASIVPAQKQTEDEQIPLPPPILDSPALTPAASREDLGDDYEDQRKIPPHSPFYQHRPDSFDRGHSRQNSKIQVALNEKDLEAGKPAPLTIHSSDAQPFTSKVSLDCNKECKMWPSKQTLMERRKAERKKKRDTKFCGGCAPVVDYWETKTKRQRLIVKIVLALLCIGVVVGIAVGITIAVHGTVYVTDNRTAKIPNPENN